MKYTMTRNSGIADQECYSYGLSTPEVQFLPNPNTRSNHRLLTPSVTSTLFDDDEHTETTRLNHDYEDPSRLAQQALASNSRGPRKKANDVYEPMAVPLKTLDNVKHRVRNLSHSSDEDSTTGYTYHGREPIFNRIILYLVLLLSLTATTLVVLMIFGFVGPPCHCGSSKTTTDSTEQGRTSQQYSRSVDPLKMTIAELQANLTKLEALLNKTKTNLNIPANDSISIFDVQRNFDQKLNATKDQLLAEDGRIKGEVSALNISLNSKIQGISGVEVKQGPPGYNGSRGDPGPIGPQGIQGPPGLGNFSQCRHLVETQTTHSQSSISIIANKVQPEGYIILSASCSTVGTVEYNLEINVPSVGGNPNFVCTCKGKSALFPSPDSKYYCHLHYLLCPKTT